MSLLADIQANLPTFRDEAERLMVDTVTFSEPGEQVFNSTTGQYETTAGATIYTGKCRVQVTDVIPRDATVGEQQVAIERTIIQIPWDAPAIPVNSVGEITAVDDLSGSPLGAKYRVTGTHDKTHATADPGALRDGVDVIEIDGLDGFIIDLTKAGLTAGLKVVAVFEQEGPEIRDQARALAPRHRLPHYAGKITSEVGIDGTTVTLEVGPETGGQGNLGHILERGTSITPPHAHLGPAMDLGAPQVVKRLSDVLGDL